MAFVADGALAHRGEIAANSSTQVSLASPALDINVPISCGDAPVFPGDVLVGDRDGVMVIPAHLADELADECTEMESYEDFVLTQVKDGEPIIGLYPRTKDEYLAKYESWRKENGR